ncbi:hypothetical protein GCM10022215_31680 [Nocardioides fonticola]|uniref:CopG family transcriptional regulator n=1 Tax=Nocardioides fonticola TaxID=450363 RepID=A0ABP7XR42_9ACTN
MASQQTFEKVSLTIEADVLHRVRDRVEPGRLSAYTTLALRRQLERDGLDDLIAELVEVNGPLDPDAVARHVEEWR